jgi:hypothetical protein
VTTVSCFMCTERQRSERKLSVIHEHIPCFMKAIHSMKTVYKVKFHKSKLIFPLLYM